MLDIQTIDAALFFLGRADLKGNEVPDFVRVSNALQQEKHIQIEKFQQERAAAMQQATTANQHPVGTKPRASRRKATTTPE